NVALRGEGDAASGDVANAGAVVGRVVLGDELIGRLDVDRKTGPGARVGGRRLRLEGAEGAQVVIVQLGRETAAEVPFVGGDRDAVDDAGQHGDRGLAVGA